MGHDVKGQFDLAKEESAVFAPSPAPDRSHGSMPAFSGEEEIPGYRISRTSTP